jgi:hypothetical protein
MDAPGAEARPGAEAYREARQRERDVILTDRTTGVERSWG